MQHSGSAASSVAIAALLTTPTMLATPAARRLCSAPEHTSAHAAVRTTPAASQPSIAAEQRSHPTQRSAFAHQISCKH